MVATLREKFRVLSPVMNERARRRWAAVEAMACGWGGVSCVSRATGISRTTILRGKEEIEAESSTEQSGVLDERIRRPGAGRKPLTETDPLLMPALERLIDPMTRGDPQSPLRWTCKSKSTLAAALTEQGNPVSATTVGRLLHRMGYSLQAVSKNREGASHPDRNAQFEHINAAVEKFQSESQPVISVDTKKKELVGDFSNAGREWQPRGKPEEALVHDFPNDATGKAIPYGVYDLSRNEGFVSVGCDHDTSAFAVASIRQWWITVGTAAYPNADRLLITADAGGSNGYRRRAWKTELQKFADETGLTVCVSHFPPGTSKWNKIEHRLFCYITQNWRGKPLRTYETVINLIGHTRTSAGLRVRAVLDPSRYPTGTIVTKTEMKGLALRPLDFHGDWNYEIAPRTA